MLSPVSVLFAHRVDPAVWGFVQANALKAQVVAIGVTINGVEDSEGFFRKVFGRWNAVQHDRLVVRNGFQEIDHGTIAGSVTPLTLSIENEFSSKSVGATFINAAGIDEPSRSSH